MVNGFSPDGGPLPPLPAEREIAIAFTPAAWRPLLNALHRLDARLGQVVSRSREPLLAQVGLAWWRDRLTEDCDAWPRADPLLTLVATTWGARSAALVPLVDGWENLVGEGALAAEAISAFAEGRGQAFANFGELAGARDRHAIAAAGRRWALADLGKRTSSDAERAMARELAKQIAPTPSLPRQLRGLAVLDRLAQRAVKRDGALLPDRAAALLAWRVGMFGR
ncbi:hypothetical protein GRI40_02435 [Altererythrobacter aerius]|uniref:Phytoene synthase n=1 Tax=Tsuneonella aeria TaxID=1837929 RepID=A0A6I4TCE0_9SPHN|nr:hypothetical protein [Tsuneonella aeria]MXO74078.1 hypothetical protein [Tsuneonella aeria]